MPMRFFLSIPVIILLLAGCTHRADSVPTISLTADDISPPENVAGGWRLHAKPLSEHKLQIEMINETKAPLDIGVNNAEPLSARRW